eukprot:CAMPEP_0115722858 /NCGR_PEP_ID=MMETSP0272-20121206/79914_1 /TAXON_ID=71861 /ORGANISM="Scrippsiella trochoidea, Strain CCMP3099" /LENGTH=96 /DNA_ID=CAMNT_0003165933 /DNA_START=305 /DNA_END=592 /DNA_ORIENTATION=-
MTWLHMYSTRSHEPAALTTWRYAGTHSCTLMPSNERPGTAALSRTEPTSCGAMLWENPLQRNSSAATASGKLSTGNRSSAMRRSRRRARRLPAGGA